LAINIICKRDKVYLVTEELVKNFENNKQIRTFRFGPF
jgi:hypothetical protein